VGVADVVERDADGDLFVRLTKGPSNTPTVRLAPDRGEATAGAPGMGDRLLVRFERLEGGETEARLIKRLGQSAHRLLGVVRKGRGETRVEPVDRKSRERLILTGPDAATLSDGDLVLAEVGSARERYGPKQGKLLEVVGREDEPRAASMIAGRHLTARRSSSIADAATAGLRRWVRRRERFAGRERGRHEDLEIDVPDRALALGEDGLREVAQHLAAEEAVAVLLLGRKVEARGARMRPMRGSAGARHRARARTPRTRRGHRRTGNGR